MRGRRLFNYLFARKRGGKFIIRIEDTDSKRNVAGGEENQLDVFAMARHRLGRGRRCRRRRTVRTGRRSGWICTASTGSELIERGLAYNATARRKSWSGARGADSPRRDAALFRQMPPSDRRGAARLEAEGREPSIRFRVPEGRTIRFDDMVKGRDLLSSPTASAISSS